MNKNHQQRNEAFYSKKRCILRKAQQISKQCDTDVFILLHKHDTDRVFTFTTDSKFDFQRVQSLVERDFSDRISVRKAQKFEKSNMMKIDQKIQQIQTIIDNQDYQSSQDNDNEDTQNCNWQSSIPSNENSGIKTDSITQQTQQLQRRIGVDYQKEQMKNEIKNKELQDDINKQNSYNENKSMDSCPAQVQPTSNLQLQTSKYLSIPKVLTQQNLETDKHLILTPRDYSNGKKDTSNLQSSKHAKTQQLDVMDLLKQDFDQPKPTTPKSVSSAHYNSQDDIMEDQQELNNQNNENEIQEKEENTHHLETVSYQNVYIKQQPQVDNKSQIEEPNEDEEILDCDDIIMFNNWDDIRQDNLAYYM